MSVQTALGAWRIAAASAGCAAMIAGCGGSDEPATSKAAAGGASSAYPVTVRNCGRTLTFDKAPSRVIADYEPTLKVLLDLGVADRVIGQTKFNEGEPALPAGQMAAKRRIPEISKDISLPPKEKTLSLGPDLVYAVAPSEFKASDGRATIKQLERIGAKTFIGSAWCTDADVPKATIGESYDDILDMGRIFGVSDRAEQLVARQQATVADAEKKVRGLEPVRVVAYNEGRGPLSLVGAGLVGEILRRAGAVNVLGGAKAFVDASVEAVAKANPDAFVIFDYPSFDGRSGTTADEKARTLFKLLPTTAAAKSRRWVKMYAVDQHPGGFNADAVARVAEQLHPEAFK